MKSFITHLAISSLFAAATTLAVPVSAGPVQETLELEFKIRNHSSLFPAGSDSMRIHYNNGDADTRKTMTVAAGMFSGTAVEGENTTINTGTLFKDANNVFAYCIDIMKLLQDTAVYHIQNIQQDEVYVDEDTGVRRDFGRMLTFLGAVNQVQQDNFNVTPDSKNWLRPSAGWMSGAIQLGIWESLYEKQGADLSVRHAGGNDTQWFWADVSSNHSNTRVDTRGLDFLDDVFHLVNNSPTDFSAVSAREVLWAINANGQDVLIDPVDVPVPATGFLLLAGVGAFAARRRRQVSFANGSLTG